MNIFKKTLFIFSLLVIQNSFSTGFVKKLFLGPDSYPATDNDKDAHKINIITELETITMNNNLGHIDGAGKYVQTGIALFFNPDQQAKLKKIIHSLFNENEADKKIKSLSELQEVSAWSPKKAYLLINELQQAARENSFDELIITATPTDKALKCFEKITALGLLTFGVYSLLKSDPSKLVIPAITAGATLAGSSILTEKTRPTFISTSAKFGLAALAGTIAFAGNGLLNGSLRGFNR